MKKQLLFLAVAVLLSVGLGVGTGIYANSAKSDKDVAQNAVYDKQNELSAKESEVATKESKLLYDYTGISEAQVDADKAVAKTFFEPAFSWVTGDQYNVARAKFIEVLGSDNSFVVNYMTENTMIDNYNKIDVNKLKSSWDDITVYPLEITSNGYSYMAVVSFYLYKEESDLSAKSKLNKSQAIIMYSVAHDASAKNDRTGVMPGSIMDVSAWSGVDSISATSK